MTRDHIEATRLYLRKLCGDQQWHDGADYALDQVLAASSYVLDESELSRVTTERDQWRKMFEASQSDYERIRTERDVLKAQVEGFHAAANLLETAWRQAEARAHAAEREVVATSAPTGTPGDTP